MRHAHLAAALVGLVGFGFPAVALAEPYLSARDAKRYTKQVVNERYGDEIVRPVFADCHPVGLDAPEPGYVYKFWTCDWAAESAYDDEVCDGRLRIAGHRRHDWFRWRVMRGLQCY